MDLFIIINNAIIIFIVISNRKIYSQYCQSVAAIFIMRIIRIIHSIFTFNINAVITTMIVFTIINRVIKLFNHYFYDIHHNHQQHNIIINNAIEIIL